MNNPTPPSVGEIWAEEGGFYAGIVRDVKSNKQWHLIVSDKTEKLIFSDEYNDIEGCSDYTDGQANTMAIIGSDHKCPAAQWAADLEVDGFSDWYLPAQKELNLIYINLSDKCAPDWHWSSTQYSASSAWFQYFEDGLQSVNSKGTKRAVRAVRRLPI